MTINTPNITTPLASVVAYIIRTEFLTYLTQKLTQDPSKMLEEYARASMALLTVLTIELGINHTELPTPWEYEELAQAYMSLPVNADRVEWLHNNTTILINKYINGLSDPLAHVLPGTDTIQ